MSDSPRVIRTTGVSPRPWANGGGVTRELLVSIDGAWRVSLAEIDREGAFSRFPGRRRLLTVVEGPVLTLVVDGVEHVVEPRRPFAFDGAAEVSATVPEGAVRALNVIADPGVVQPSVTVLELGRESRLPLADDQAAMVLQGRPRVGGDEMQQLDLVAGPAELTGRCTLAVISLTRDA